MWLCPRESPNEWLIWKCNQRSPLWLTKLPDKRGIFVSTRFSAELSFCTIFSWKRPLLFNFPEYLLKLFFEFEIEFWKNSSRIIFVDIVCTIVCLPSVEYIPLLWFSKFWTPKKFLSKSCCFDKLACELFYDLRLGRSNENCKWTFQCTRVGCTNDVSSVTCTRLQGVTGTAHGWSLLNTHKTRTRLSSEAAPAVVNQITAVIVGRSHSLTQSLKTWLYKQIMICIIINH